MTAPCPSCRCRKPAFNIGDKVAHDVILVPVLRLRGGVGVIGRIAFGHDENQSGFGKACYVGIVRPGAKTAATTMEQVNRGKFFTRANALGKHYAVLHIAIQRSTVKCDILHDHICGEARMVIMRDFVLLLFATD